jgi:alkanesulfonate monooxygenase SsuD/methylene tetrahydromethanopterin reductase-like flavin-dependent oxidoreductase (luciferase family)
MRFAFKTTPQNTTWTDMLAVWQEADDIDVYESGWTFDHFYPIFTDSTGPCLEGWTTLAALAQATTQLRLGTMVTGIHYRHPAVLANMAAALDTSPTGDSSSESALAAVSRNPMPTASSSARSGSAWIASKKLDARNEPEGPQRPHPPICIGGFGEKRTLPLVARYAQHWNYAAGTPQDFGDRRDVLAARCADVGRDLSDITTSTHLFVGDPMRARTPNADFTPTDRDYDRFVTDAITFGEKGLDLAIVYLPLPYNPAVVEKLAEAITRANLPGGDREPNNAK